MVARACSGSAPQFWDTLAPHHWLVENNYLDLASVRLILGGIRQPVLVVGAGQGLIVQELRRQGLRCDGIDLSARMVEYARVRRGLTLVRANATAMPFADGTYETVIIATGILRGDTLHVRSALALHRLGFGALVVWVAKTAGVSMFRALLLCIGTGLRSTTQERAAALATRRVIAQAGDSAALIEAAPETQPYRDMPAIGRLLEGLSMGIEDWQTSSSCQYARTTSAGASGWGSSPAGSAARASTGHASRRTRKVVAHL